MDQDKEKIGGGGGRLPIVDYLKAFCIVLVILHHTEVFDTIKPIYIMIIDMAVPVFMILSGYVVGINSSDKSLAWLYDGNRLLRKLLRYIVPMLITYFLFEGLWMVGRGIFSGGISFGWRNVQHFILFEFGPGAYYFALMIEFLFLSPLIFWTVRRYDFHGVLLVGLLDFFYEICSGAYGFNQKIYRILIFRYLFAIAIGMYTGLHKEKLIRNEYLIGSFTVGLIYILLPSFFNYSHRLFTGATWATTSMVAVMYIFPIIHLILYYGYGHTSASEVGRVLELIGRASYHILCTQMIYFSVRPYLYQYLFDISKLGKVPVLLFDTVVSLLTGIAFYYVDSRFLTGRLIRGVKRQRKNIENC